MASMFTMRKGLPVLILGLAGLSVSWAQSQQQLEHSIADIKTTLAQKKSQLNDLQNDLQQSETALANAQNTLKQTDQQLKQQTVQMHKLQQQEQQLDNKLEQQQQKLAKHLQTAYILGRQPYLKMLLNQQNPYQISRIITYYRFINGERISAIKILQGTVDKIVANQTQIKDHRQKLLALKTQLQQDTKKLQQARQKRGQAVSQLNQSITNSQAQLANLLNNKEKLLDTLHRVKYGFTQNYRGVNFRHYKHKLPWPVPGKVLHLFGQSIHDSQIKWNGVLIEAPLGRPVRAIAGGKVIFSKWLAGYGFLIIISHGHGYMSLYGRNQTLYKHLGDTVHSGDVIATVGKSGGYKTPALYFAIRHYSRPLNPVAWCR